MSTSVPLESTATEAQAVIAEEFAYFGDWTERYQYLIDLGRQLAPFPDERKTEENRVHGCQSMVWLIPSGDASKMHFDAASDSATLRSGSLPMSSATIASTNWVDSRA